MYEIVIHTQNPYEIEIGIHHEGHCTSNTQTLRLQQD